METVVEQRYFGRIVSIPGNDGYAFIGIGTVTKDDGTNHGLQTREDIFLHKDNCGSPLKVGMQITFDILPDKKRGGDTWCAIGATECTRAELIPDNESPIPGLVPTASNATHLCMNRRIPAHINMKKVPAEVVDKVVANQPMPDMPRTSELPADEEGRKALVEEFLARLFPNMGEFGTDYRVIETSDEELDRIVSETEGTYSQMGMSLEIEVLRHEIQRFKQMRGALALMLKDNLIRPDAVIPIKYLPDLFMAVPVWYHWVADQELVERDWNIDDPKVNETIRYFCDLFPNQVWRHTFQLFNRRTRTLKQYQGEIIPPAVARRMKEAIDLFDYVVIATPYHDQAGKDWQDINWLRAIDPYVLGFKKGVPFFFVLARFSDSGTFPLFNELVADTIDFLKTNKQKLSGFNMISSPNWYLGKGPNDYVSGSTFGTTLIHHVDTLLGRFENHTLFEWLRGE